MKVLYDTSVLIAALLVEYSSHDAAFSKLELARRGEVQGYLSTHSFAELYSVMTRLPPPLRVTPEEAVEILTDLAEYVEPIPLVATDYQRAIALMAQLNLPGGGIFDAVIAQAALKTSVDRLMTFNAKDFVRLGQEISALVQVPK